jgi:hypothetical protein
MVSFDNLKELIYGFNGVSEAPHFDRIAFKTKRIFITFQESTNSANFNLTIDDQANFCKYQPKAIMPVPNKFGLLGWTAVLLKFTDRDNLFALVEAAYNKSKVSIAKK